MWRRFSCLPVTPGLAAFAQTLCEQLKSLKLANAARRALPAIRLSA